MLNPSWRSCSCISMRSFSSFKKRRNVVSSQCLLVPSSLRWRLKSEKSEEAVLRDLGTLLLLRLLASLLVHVFPNHLLARLIDAEALKVARHEPHLLLVERHLEGKDRAIAHAVVEVRGALEALHALLGDIVAILEEHDALVAAVLVERLGNRRVHRLRHRVGLEPDHLAVRVVDEPAGEVVSLRVAGATEARIRALPHLLASDRRAGIKQANLLAKDATHSLLQGISHPASLSEMGTWVPTVLRLVCPA